MKILHLSHRDHVGGAAIASQQLHQALLNCGQQSQMLVLEKRSQDPHIIEWPQGTDKTIWSVKKKISRALEKLQRCKEHNFYSLNIFGASLLEKIEELDPDIIHLHWIGGEMLRIEDIPRISKPIVWTFHDMWPVCGSEHLPLSGLNRIENGYTIKNRPMKQSGVDWNRLAYQRKIRSWVPELFTAIAPSAWSQDVINRSAINKAGIIQSTRIIPNGINTKDFFPGSKKDARERLGIPADKRVLLMGANSLNIPSKGGDLLASALQQLPELEHYLILTFGSNRLKLPKTIHQMPLGTLDDKSDICSTYQAADLTLVPSRIESFGLVAAESLACSTPVVCFKTTGLKDVVQHQVNGYSATPFEPKDLSEGIQWCLQNEQHLNQLGRAGYQHIHKHFELSLVAETHIKLYHTIISH